MVSSSRIFFSFTESLFTCCTHPQCLNAMDLADRLSPSPDLVRCETTTPHQQGMAVGIKTRTLPGGSSTGRTSHRPITYNQADEEGCRTISNPPAFRPCVVLGSQKYCGQHTAARGRTGGHIKVRSITQCRSVGQHDCTTRGSPPVV